LGPRADIRQQFGQLLPPFAARSLLLISREQQSQVVPQPTINRILEINLENLRSRISFRSAPLKWTL
jgi:hypothetical protein